MVSFILICFHLLRLTITASLWQTNAPGAKISRLAVAHRSPSSGQILGHFESFYWRSRVEAEGYWLCLLHGHLSSIRHATLSTHTHIHTPSHCYCSCFDKTKKKRRGCFIALDRQCQYIECFTTLLSKGLARLWLQSIRAKVRVIARGGGWETGKSSVEAWRWGNNKRGQQLTPC